jgi:hypothetical protein
MPNYTIRDVYSSNKSTAHRTAKIQAEFALQNIEALRTVDTVTGRHERALRSIAYLLRNGEDITGGQMSYLESIYEMVMGAKGLPSVKVHSDKKRRALRFG